MMLVMELALLAVPCFRVVTLPSIIPLSAESPRLERPG
jgi:hypothetical protein